MTYKEISIFIEEKSKYDLTMNYNLASMISHFVNLGLNGKPIPSIGEMYPGLFNTVSQPEEDNRWMLWKERMIDYAHEHNKRRKLQKEGG